MLFVDRSDAGRRLAERLLRFRSDDTIVYALPRGGVPVAFEVARALAAPLELVLVRKIGVPWQPELALGAVVEGDPPQLVLNEEILALFEPGQDWLDAAMQRELGEIERRRQVYLEGRARRLATGRVAIVIDDGLATGATARAALRALRAEEPSHLVLAVPLAPEATIESLRAEADEIVCLECPEPFGAIGAFYERFAQLDDDEVKALLSTDSGQD